MYPQWDMHGLHRRYFKFSLERVGIHVRRFMWCIANGKDIQISTIIHIFLWKTMFSNSFQASFPASFYEIFSTHVKNLVVKISSHSLTCLNKVPVGSDNKIPIRLIKHHPTPPWTPFIICPDRASPSYLPLQFLLLSVPKPFPFHPSWLLS